MAIRIRDGKIHEFDLIKCDNKRYAFMASIGIEGALIHLRNQFFTHTTAGLRTYLWAAFNAYFRGYKRAIAAITVDDVQFGMANLLSLMVVKQPYYGFGINIVPKARFDDGKLHILYINSGLFMCAIGVLTAFTIGNRIGNYCIGRKVSIRLNHPLILQTDGNYAWEAKYFSFALMPHALKVKC